MMTTLLFLTYFFVVTACIGATAFPILFAFSQWEKSIVGRAMMTMGVALALALDGTLLFQFWAPDSVLFIVSANLFVFMLLTVATWFLTYKMWKHNHLLPRRRKQTDMTSPNYVPEHAAPRPAVSNYTYDSLKQGAQLVLPALGALYFALAMIWGLPEPEKVVGSIAAVNVFLGVVVTWMSSRYNKSDEKYDGTMHVSTTEDGLVQAGMVLKNYENPAEVVTQKEVLFKVETS